MSTVQLTKADMTVLGYNVEDSQDSNYFKSNITAVPTLIAITHSNSIMILVISKTISKVP